MEVIWAILCQNAVVDKNTNQISLQNVVEEMTMLGQPPEEETDSSSTRAGVAIPTQFKLVTMWLRSDVAIAESGFGRMRIVFPHDESVISAEQEIDLTEYLRLRQVVDILTIPLKGAGIYKFVIEYKETEGSWTSKYELPLRIVINPENG